MRLIKIIIVQGIAIIALMLGSISLYFRYETTVVQINSLLINMKQMVIAIYESIINFFESVRSEYGNIREIFDARELAAIIWILIFVLYLLLSNKLRKQAFSVFKAFINWKLMKIWLGVAFYSWVIVLCLIHISFWDISLLKTTLIWYITVGLITTFKAFSKIKDANYISYMIKENIKFTVLIEFVGSLYTFSFLTEFLLQPFVVFLYLMISVIETRINNEDKNMDKIKTGLQFTIGIIGFSILYHSIKTLIISWGTTDFIGMGKEIILPIIMSTAIIFYDYVWVMISQFESLKIRLSFKKTIDDKFRWYLYLRIRLACGFSIKKLINFISVSEIMIYPISSYGDVNETIKRFRLNWSTAESFT